MLRLESAGIRVDDVLVPWGVLAEGGIFPTTAVTHYAQAHQAVLERAVWAVWRAHITGNAVAPRGGLEH